VTALRARSVVTGTTCRYEPADHLTWRL